MAGPAQRGTLLRPVLPGVPAAYYLIAQEVPVRSHGTSVLAATLDTKRPKPRGDGGSVEVHRLAPAARTLQPVVVDGDSRPCGEASAVSETMAGTSSWNLVGESASSQPEKGSYNGRSGPQEGAG